MIDFFEKYANQIMPEPNSGCWIWIGAQISAGYGHGHRENVHFYAHRAAYEAIKGARSADGLVVRHQCDFPPCCNPDHLLIGTQVDNARDMIERGRANPAIGERSHKALLTEKDVIRIRQMAADGMTIDSITEIFPVGRNAITAAIIGATWAHVPCATDYVRIKPMPPHRSGEKNNLAILTDIEADEIKKALLNGAKGVDLAEKYQVSPSTISAIKTGRIRK